MKKENPSEKIPKEALEEAPKPDVSVPITLHQIEDEIKKRVSYIDKEFTEGFEFIKNQPKSITIFGGARAKPADPYYQKARSLAHKLSKEGYSVITGGGPGIMEGANLGAFEGGGESVGLTIKLPHEQNRNNFLTHSLDFYYFFVRKVMLSFSAEAYIFFPGGFGTLDELFEILTLVQSNKIEKVPIFLVGSEYWNGLETFLKEKMLAEMHAISESDLELYKIIDDEESIVEMIKKVPIRNGVRVQY